jgi:hypothetical protein
MPEGLEEDAAAGREGSLKFFHPNHKWECPHWPQYIGVYISVHIQ